MHPAVIAFSLATPDRFQPDWEDQRHTVFASAAAGRAVGLHHLRAFPGGRLVYARCMARTNIDIDEIACRAVMDRYQLGSKRDAVNLALRTLAAEPFDLDDARALRGSGWDGDLAEMRASRTE